MAASQSGSGMDDKVCCSVCMEQFDNGSHMPSILPCEHTFCKACIESVAKKHVLFPCPICRTDHKMPSDGFTVNRVVLDIVEKLQNSAKAVLKCARHDNMECGLVCTDCLVGLCFRCMITKDHYNHSLVELAEAESLLGQKLKEMTTKQESEVEFKEFKIDGSMYSKTEVGKVKTDIAAICDEAHTAIDVWENEQVSVLQTLVEKVETQENELKEAKQTLDSVRGDGNIGTLFEKIKQARANHTKALKPLDLPRDDAYDLNIQFKVLLQTIGSIVESKDSFSSKLLKKTDAPSESEGSVPSFSDESSDCTKDESSDDLDNEASDGTDNDHLGCSHPQLLVVYNKSLPQRQSPLRNQSPQQRPGEKQSPSRSQSPQQKPALKQSCSSSRSSQQRPALRQSPSSSHSPQQRPVQRQSPSRSLSSQIRPVQMRSPSRSRSSQQRPEQRQSLSRNHSPQERSGQMRSPSRSCSIQQRPEQRQSQFRSRSPLHRSGQSHSLSNPERHNPEGRYLCTYPWRLNTYSSYYRDETFHFRAGGTGQGRKYSGKK